MLILRQQSDAKDENVNVVFFKLLKVKPKVADRIIFVRN